MKKSTEHMLIAPAILTGIILLRKLFKAKQEVLKQDDKLQQDIEEFNAEHYETFDDDNEPQDIGRVKRRIYVEIEEAQRRGIPLGNKFDALTSINKADLKAIGEQFGWKQSSVSKASGKPYAEAYFGSLKRAYNAISGTTHVVKDEAGNTILTWRDSETAAEQAATLRRVEELERQNAEIRNRIKQQRRKPVEQILREERERAHQERHMTIQDQILAKWPYLKTYTPENPKGEVRNDFQYVWWVEIKNRNREVQAAGPKAAYMRREDAPIKERTRTINQYYGYEATPSAYTTQKLIPVADVNLNSRGVGKVEHFSILKSKQKLKNLFRYYDEMLIAEKEYEAAVRYVLDEAGISIDDGSEEDVYRVLYNAGLSDENGNTDVYENTRHAREILLDFVISTLPNPEREIIMENRKNAVQMNKVLEIARKFADA